MSAAQLAGLTVLSVRVAPDAARIALVVEGPELSPALMVGWVRWNNGVPSVGGLTSVAPQITDVRDVACSGPTDLAVVGTVEGRFAEVAVVSVDGSRVTESVQSGITYVAAFSDEPLLAITGDETLILQVTTTNWSTVTAAEAVSHPGVGAPASQWLTRSGPPLRWSRCPERSAGPRNPCTRLWRQANWPGSNGWRILRGQTRF